METTAAVVTTCRPYMICEPIHVQLTYVFIDSDGVTRFISIGRIVDARGGTVEFAYPAYGTFVRITGSQHWCDRLTRNCGTTPTTSEELPASAP